MNSFSGYKTFYWSILFLYFSTIFSATYAQTYHTDDKEALRRFLRQASAISGQCNTQQLGLTPTDTSNWSTSEEWVGKVTGLTWNSSSPKRLTYIRWSSSISGNLDMGLCSSLVSLDCSSYFCSLKNLDVSKNTNLYYLYCNGLFSQLDVSKNTKLIQFTCYAKLSGLDLSNNKSLTHLTCSGMPSLDLSNNRSLKELYCYDVETLDLSQNTALTRINCISEKLKNLDLSYNVNLTDVYLGEAIETINVNNCKSLQTLHFEKGSMLKNLDVTNNKNLTSLFIYSSQLTNLDVSQNTALNFLCCSSGLFKISTLPNKPASVASYIYSPQTTLQGGRIDYTQGIDLSSEFSRIINGVTQLTTYSWFDELDNPVSSDLITDNGNGTFTLSPRLSEKTVHCRMKNNHFPDLTLQYTVTINKNNETKMNLPDNIKTSVYLSDGMLHIEGADCETIEIYSLNGKKLYSVPKQDSKISIHTSAWRKSALIVRGSSGWSTKVINQ